MSPDESEPSHGEHRVRSHLAARRGRAHHPPGAPAAGGPGQARRGTRPAPGTGHLPREAATEAGIDAVEAFIGSGTYAVQLEIGRDDVQQVLATFLNDPRVRAFRDQLEPVTEGLPGPDYHFGGPPMTPPARRSITRGICISPPACTAGGLTEWPPTATA